MKRQTKNSCWHKSNQQIHDQTLRTLLFSQVKQHMAEFFSVLPAHCEYGAKLNHNLKHLAAFVIKIEQITSDNQVAGTTYGDKFCGTFYQAENKCFKQD